MCGLVNGSRRGPNLIHFMRSLCRCLAPKLGIYSRAEKHQSTMSILSMAKATTPPWDWNPSKHRACGTTYITHGTPKAPRRLCVKLEAPPVQQGKRQPAHITQKQIQASCQEFCNNLCCIEVLDEWSPHLGDMEEQTWPEELRRWPYKGYVGPSRGCQSIARMVPKGP